MEIGHGIQCLSGSRVGRRRCLMSKDENISNHGFIGHWILWIYREITVEYFDPKKIDEMEINQNS